MRHIDLSKRPIIDLPVDQAIAYEKNPHQHPERQLEMIEASFRKFGMINPILVASNYEVIAGHGRLTAAQRLGLATIPAIVLPHLNEAEIKAFRIADNKIAEKGTWSIELLAEELELVACLDLDFKPISIGMETGEVDFVIDSVVQLKKSDSNATPVLEPDRSEPPTSRAGDIFTIGSHKVICGDARNPLVYQAVLGNRLADAVISDQPWNLPANFISGLGQTQHRDFPVAHGEMSENEFSAFTETVLGNQARFSKTGASSLQFIDWRSVDIMIRAGKQKVGTLVNICIWVKPSGAMGSRWRSRHEMICIFNTRDGKSKNNVQLGKYGRFRTNVWEYASPSGFGAEREKLKLHPTCKNEQMIADAIMDITDRNDVVLDAFLGSGTTILAAHQTGRIGIGIELDPHYVDLAVGRIAAATGKPAIDAHGNSFDALRLARSPVVES